jgi:hypothetical protein
MSVVHLIERVPNPAGVYADIRSLSPSACTVVDLSSGRVGAVSMLDPGTLPGGEECRWIRASEYEGALADQTRKDYVSLVHELGSKEVADGKNIKNLLAYDLDFSLWWLSETSEKHAINHPLRWCIYCCSLIDRLFESGEIEEGLTWRIWAADRIVADIYKAAIGSRGSVEVQGGGREESSRGTEPISLLKVNTYNLYVLARAWALGSIKRDHKSSYRERDRDSSDQDVLVVSVSDTGWKKVAEPEAHDSGVEYYDSYMGYMPWNIEDGRIRVSWLRNTISRKEYTSWRERWLNGSERKDASCHAILGPRAALRVFANANRMAASYNRLIAGRGSQGTWSYKGISLDALIDRDLRALCTKRAVNYMVRFEQYRKAVETIRPTAVLYKSEMFIPGRLISAAMKGRTRLVALQHGIHIDEALVYQFDPRDVGGSNW